MKETSLSSENWSLNQLFEFLRLFFVFITGITLLHHCHWLIVPWSITSWLVLYWDKRSASFAVELNWDPQLYRIVSHRSLRSPNQMQTASATTILQVTYELPLELSLTHCVFHTHSSLIWTHSASIYLKFTMLSVILSNGLFCSMPLQQPQCSSSAAATMSASSPCSVLLWAGLLIIFHIPV